MEPIPKEYESRLLDFFLLNDQKAPGTQRRFYKVCGENFD